jgi:hypothetical protein
MFFNWRLFLRALRLSLLNQRFSVRRWTYVLSFTFLFLIFLAFVMLGRLLDHILFPEFRKQQVKAPVFVIAPPRSGTTLVQRLLSYDGERFVHLKMYQTIFPAICFQKLIDAATSADNFCGWPIQRGLSWLEKWCFGGWDEMHKLRLNQPEEDDALFLYAFESEAIYLLFPFVHELWEAGFPDALPPDQQHRLMAYYRSCLQRHLYANGPSQTLLSKATQSSGTVLSLMKEFPDARFVTIIRDPCKSVASHVSLFVPVWQKHSPEITSDGEVSKAYAYLAIEWYKHLFQFRNVIDPARYYCIDYRELTQNPRAMIQEVYKHFGWSISEDYAATLDEATGKQKAFKSNHHYSLAQFGLSEEWIQRELGELLDAYGLEQTSTGREQSHSAADRAVAWRAAADRRDAADVATGE